MLVLFQLWFENLLAKIAMGERFRFSLKKMLVATAMIALWVSVFRAYGAAGHASMAVYLVAVVVYSIPASVAVAMYGKVWFYLLFGVVPAAVLLTLEFIRPLFYGH